MDENLYGNIMQIAVVIPDEQAAEIDRLVPGQYRSRAEVVRVALDELLRTLRRQRIDDQYLAALDAINVGERPPALQAGDPEPAGWVDIPW